MVRKLVFLLALSIVAFGAQDPDLKTLDHDQAHQLAATWIVANNPRQQAWAAQLIAQHRLQDLYTALPGALHGLTPAASGEFRGSEEELAIEAVSDAIIKLGLRVLSSDARKLYPEFPALAMILLSQTSDDNTADLFSIFQEAKVGEVWLAAANLLALKPTPEFVERLVDDLSIFVRILVFESDAGGGMSYGDCVAPQWDQLTADIIPSDWPVFSSYSLEPAKNGGTIFATGANPVSYLASLKNDLEPWTGHTGCGGLQLQDLRRHLLVQLSGMNPADVKLHSVVLKEMTFENDDQCRQGILTILREQVDSFNSIVGRLTPFLGPSQVQHPLHMELWIIPSEGAHIPELPTLASLGIAGQYHFDPK